MKVLCHPAVDINGINIVCKEKKPSFEVLRAKSGESGNYKWNPLTDYYTKVGGGATKQS